MELSDQKYLRINNILENLSNYNKDKSSPNNFLKDTIHSFIESILYYKLFIDNYAKLNNYVNKYSDYIHSILDSNISDSEKTDILKKILQKILVKQQTGGMNMRDFQTKIFKHADEAIEKANVFESNQKYLIEKIDSVKKRLNAILDNENLFNTRQKIEQIVNELEKKSGEKIKINPIDYTPLFNDLQQKIDEIRKKGDDQVINNYITELEKFASHIENFVVTSTKTTDAAHLSGGNNNRKTLILNIQGGSIAEQNSDENIDIVDLKKKHINEYKIKIDKLKKLEFGKIFDLLTEKSSEQIYGQAIIIEKLFYILTNFVNVYNNYITELRQNQITLTLIKDMNKWWDLQFVNKNTSYYQDLKKKEIYFFRTIENAINFCNIIDIQYIFQELTLTNYIDLNIKIIEKLDTTLVYLNIINNIFILVLLSYYLFSNEENQTNQDNAITYLRETFNNLPKSFILTTFDEFSILYENLTPAVMKGGSSSETKETTEEYETFVLFHSEFVPSILNGEKTENSKTVIESLNKNQIEKTGNLIQNVKDVISKIANKLTPGTGAKEINNSIPINSDIKTFTDLYNTIKKNTSQNGGSNTTTITKPRLDPFKIALEQCLEKLRPYLKNIEIFKNLLKQFSSGKLDIKETRSLLKLYNILDEETKKGINSYIQVIPMIFFTIEFPPAIYSKDLCKYGLSYDQNTENYTYKLITEKKSCKSVDLEKTTEISVPTHATFFQADEKNGTRKLIEDPIIGLKKLINSSSSDSGPANKVINMMFALGASGTGKTTRYFGNKVAPNPDDRIGIVTSIIEEATKTTGNTVEFAYFVSYGRYESNKLNEFLLFFDIKDENVVLPFFMPSETAQTQATIYTDFYTKLVNKKLSNIDYSVIKDYIENGGTLPKLSGEGSSTFREILEKDKNIWLTVDQSTELDSIFEGLLTRQKKMHTVLPTKNNIESSRGHTCVLIKITNVNGVTKYFPLFDMAGTENTEKMNDFLRTNRKADKMAHIVSLFSEYSQKNKLMNGEIGQINSLEDLVGENGIDKFKNYVKASEQKASEQEGGSKFNVNDVDEAKLNSDKGGENLLTKMVNEGFYINHTIGMLIFAAMCVGQSMNSTVTDGIDNFDNIEEDIFRELAKFTCLKTESKCTKTKLLIDEFKFISILNTTSIWAQILFSFLYWNEETEESAFNNFKSNNYQQEIIKSNLNPVVYEYVDYKLKLSDMFSSESISTTDILPDLENGKYYLQVNNDNTVSKVLSSGGDSATLKTEKAQLESEVKQLEKQISESLDDTTRAKLDDYNRKIKEIEVLETQLEPIRTQISNLTFSFNPPPIPKAEQFDNAKIKLMVGNDNWLTSISKKVKITSNGDASLVKSQIKKAKYVYKDTNTNMSKKELQDDVDKITSGLKTFKDQLNTANSKLADVNTKLEQFSKPYTKENVIKLLMQLKINKVETNGTVTFINNNSQLELETILQWCNHVKLIKKQDLQTGLVEMNQMTRIKDSQISATKMVLMHLVTGQAIKHNMVLETIELTNSLWNATQINLTN